MRFFSIAASIVFAFSVAIAGDRIPVSFMRVIDGDTIVVFDGSMEEKVRLIGIDCPEVQNNAKARKDADALGISVNELNREGYYATNFLRSRLGVNGTIEPYGRDNFGRVLAYVYMVNGRCINEILVLNGIALAKYKHDREFQYRELELTARSKRIGFWGTIWRNKERDEK